MITYKEYSPENISGFLNNEKLVLDVYNILNQSLSKIQPPRDREIISFKKTLKKNNNFVFLAFSGDKPVGVTSGYINNGVFNIKNVAIHPDYQYKGLGKKIKLRAVAYIFSKKKIERFVGLSVVNNKIYSINRAIANRQNKSLTRKYSLEPKLGSNNKYVHKDRTLKPKTNLVVKRKGKK